MRTSPPAPRRSRHPISKGSRGLEWRGTDRSLRIAPCSLINYKRFKTRSEYRHSVQPDKLQKMYFYSHGSLNKPANRAPNISKHDRIPIYSTPKSNKASEQSRTGSSGPMNWKNPLFLVEPRNPLLSRTSIHWSLHPGAALSDCHKRQQWSDGAGCSDRRCHTWRLNVFAATGFWMRLNVRLIPDKVKCAGLWAGVKCEQASAYQLGLND